MPFKHSDYESFLDSTEALANIYEEKYAKGEISEITLNEVLHVLEWLKTDLGYPKRIDNRKKG